MKKVLDFKLGNKIRKKRNTIGKSIETKEERKIKKIRKRKKSNMGQEQNQQEDLIVEYVKEEQKKKYQDYVKEVTPTHNLAKQMFNAFVCGGIICTIGQFILTYCTDNLGMETDIAGSWCSLILILCSVVLTAFHQYVKIVKWGGAGALVPITGFANSVVSTAIEFKREGQVFGVGSKIFTIAGPVILYGIFSSWVLGILYWIGKLLGVA